MIKKFLVLFFIIVLSTATVHAELVVDDSIHSKIADKYNLENLPDLPSSLQNSTIDDIFTPNEFDTEPTSKYNPNETEKAKTQPISSTSQPTTNTSTTKTTAQTVKNTNVETVSNGNVEPTYNFSENYEAVKISKGKKFKVINQAALSDSLKKDTAVTFVSTSTETNRYITIPKGTVFKGKVIDSHTPNLTGNGGLLVIKVNSVIYKGKSYPIDAKVTLANSKHIYFNNIKGKRMYWQNAKKSTAKGKKVYDKMWAKTKKYFKPNIEIIITPVTFLTGTVVYVANIAVSPVLAIFTKGGKLTIPQNSKFEIKLLDDALLYK